MLRIRLIEAERCCRKGEVKADRGGVFSFVPGRLFFLSI